MFLAIQIMAVTMLGISLAVLFWVDLKRGILPDKILLPLGMIGLALLFVKPVAPITPMDGLIGAFLGVVFMSVFRWIASLIAGREAMGLGDVKFMGMAGLWLGWQGLNPLILLGALVTLLIAVVRHGWRHRNWKDFKRGIELPLGTGLCVVMAVLVALHLCGIHVSPSLLPLSF